MRGGQRYRLRTGRVDDPRLRNLGNAALLIASFAIGQGSIFLAQTWLIRRGALELLAHFGTHFSFAILAMMIVDGGSVTALARRISLAGPDDLDQEIRNAYWQASFFRLAAAVIVGAFSLIYGLLTPDVFSRAYILAALPALLLWAFNANGVLDGLKLSGVSGLVGVLAYGSSALALLFAVDRSDAEAGLLLGAALPAGYALAVTTQLMVLHFLGHFPKYVAVRRMQVVQFGREGGAILLSNVPGQLFYRFQIIVCSVLLGEAATAVFLYGRQITAAVSQVLEFIRRAHFPSLVQALHRSDAPLRTTFQMQGIATAAAAVASLLLTAGGFFGAEVLEGNLAIAAIVVAFFATGVFTGAVSQTLSQATQALGRFAFVASATNIAMVVGLVASAAFAWFLGLAGLALAEVLTHGVVVLLLCLVVFRRAGHPGTVQAPT